VCRRERTDGEARRTGGCGIASLARRDLRVRRRRFVAAVDVLGAAVGDVVGRTAPTRGVIRARYGRRRASRLRTSGPVVSSDQEAARRHPRGKATRTHDSKSRGCRRYERAAPKSGTGRPHHALGISDFAEQIVCGRRRPGFPRERCPRPLVRRRRPGSRKTRPATDRDRNRKRRAAPRWPTPKSGSPRERATRGSSTRRRRPSRSASAHR